MLLGKISWEGKIWRRENLEGKTVSHASRIYSSEIQLGLSYFTLWANSPPEGVKRPLSIWLIINKQEIAFFPLGFVNYRAREKTKCNKLYWKYCCLVIFLHITLIMQKSPKTIRKAKPRKSCIISPHVTAVQTHLNIIICGRHSIRSKLTVNISTKLGTSTVQENSHKGTPWEHNVLPSRMTLPQVLGVLILANTLSSALSCGGGSPPPPCSWSTCRSEFRDDWAPGVSPGRCVNQRRYTHHVYGTHHGSGSCPAPSPCGARAAQDRMGCKCYIGYRLPEAHDVNVKCIFLRT